mgnify:CR=1 FL=1
MRISTLRPDAVYLSNISEIKEHLECVIKHNAEIFVGLAVSTSARRNAIDSMITAMSQLKKITEFEKSL